MTVVIEKIVKPLKKLLDKENLLKKCILNNEEIEENLHVISVVSNPCLFSRRYVLFKEYMKRMELEEKVILYVVEVIYPNQTFAITDENNPYHLQIKTETPLWHKESMVNLGVKKLLPMNWKAFAWVDADLEFESPTWASDTLKVLNGYKDVVQLFSHCIDMDREENVMRIVNSAGFRKEKNQSYDPFGQLQDYSHPGYAWAMTRRAYEKIGGIYDKGILGSGDFIMLNCFLNRSFAALQKENSKGYKDSVYKYGLKAKTLRFGYIPGIIRHFFHGSKQNRKYSERWKTLVKYQYDPEIHIHTDPITELIVPTSKMPQEFKEEIMKYFWERKEDD